VIAAAEPMGAAMYNYFRRGEFKSEGDSITERTDRINRIDRILKCAFRTRTLPKKVSGMRAPYARFSIFGAVL